MTQRQGQGYGGALADPRDERFARLAWAEPRFAKGDRIIVGVGTEDPVELLIDATGYDDARHVPIYVTVNAFGVHQYADQGFIDEHAEHAAPEPTTCRIECGPDGCAEPAPGNVTCRPVRAIPAQTCRMCSRDELDGCGVIIEGVCGDCRRAWA